MSFQRGVSSQSIPQSVLRHLFVGRALTTAGCSILFYDYLLTFSREVEFIWRAKWSTVKALFLLNRYGNLIGQTVISIEVAGLLQSSTSRAFCDKVHLMGACFLILSVESIRILVLTRAWTIWGYSRLITWFTALYVCYGAAVIAVAVYAQGSTRFQFLGALPVCFGAEAPFLWLIWLGPLLFDSIAFVMVWYSLHKLSRDCMRYSPLLCLLVRDATMFYIGSMFNNILSIICWTVYINDPRSLIELTFSLPLNSIIGQRLVLNLRGLKTQQMSTRELSREVDRQVAAMAHMLLSDAGLDESRLPENEDTPNLGVELQEMQWSRSESGGREGPSVSEGTSRKLMV